MNQSKCFLLLVLVTAIISARLITLASIIPPTVQVSLPIVHQTHKTLESEVHRLSIKYKVNERSAIAIIKAESVQYGGKAINENKNKKGEVWSRDWSFWQINDFYFKEELLKKGWDITKEKDNLEAGFYLLKTYGTSLWSASQKNWSKALSDR